MLINLLEIPDNGKSYTCNRRTAELNEVLQDLIGDIPHEAEFTIRPLNSGTFELIGHIKTEAPDQCSRCGIDIRFKIEEKFKEMMLPELDQPRNTTYSKANHFSEMVNDDLSVVDYSGHHFNMGEYLHEVVGLAIPFNPAPELSAKGDCSLCLKPIQDSGFSYSEEIEEPESPFSVLKGIKLN